MTHAVIISADELDRWKRQVVGDVLNGIKQLILCNQSEAAVDRRQLAKLLGVGIATIDRLVSTKQIPSMLINSRRVFLPSKVFTALEQERAA